jgi:hypothetical protein
MASRSGIILSAQASLRFRRSSIRSTKAASARNTGLDDWSQRDGINVIDVYLDFDVDLRES